MSYVLAATRSLFGIAYIIGSSRSIDVEAINGTGSLSQYRSPILALPYHSLYLHSLPLPLDPKVPILAI